MISQFVDVALPDIEAEVVRARVARSGGGDAGVVGAGAAGALGPAGWDVRGVPFRGGTYVSKRRREKKKKKK